MASDESLEWRTLGHRPIEELAENLWRVEGDLPRMSLKRQMIVARTADRCLLIHNGIALEDAAMARLEAWGKPTWLVVPSRYHRIDAGRFKARFPELTVLCPAGARTGVEKVVAVDGSYEDFADVDGMELGHLRGLGDREGFLAVHSADGDTLVFNDALFNQPHLPGAFGAVYKLLGQSGRPKVTAIARMAFVKDRVAYADHLRELSARPSLRRIVPGHGHVIDERAADVLRKVANDLSAARGRQDAAAAPPSG